MTIRATGPFEVKLNPLPPEDHVGDPSISRFALDKQFHGDLQAVGRGQMLASARDGKGSGGYVAIERITGLLHGRRGSFTMQHTGTMKRGKPQLSITVLPDSGTDELSGLAGPRAIIITHGKHS